MSTPAGFPQIEFGHVRAAAIAARHERRLRGLDFFQRREDVLAAGDLGRIVLRADEHEVVVHHRIAFDALPFGQEFLLGGAGVHEHDVGVAAPADIERLAGAQRDDANLDAGLLLVDRQQIAEQSRLLGRGRRGDGDEFFLCRRCESGEAKDCGQQGATGDYHGSSPSRN